MNEKTIEAMKAARRGKLVSVGQPTKLLAHLNAKKPSPSRDCEEAVTQTTSAQLIGSMKGRIKVRGDIMSTGVRWNAQA